MYITSHIGGSIMDKKFIEYLFMYALIIIIMLVIYNVIYFGLINTSIEVESSGFMDMYNEIIGGE